MVLSWQHCLSRDFAIHVSNVRAEYEQCTKACRHSGNHLRCHHHGRTFPCMERVQRVVGRPPPRLEGIEWQGRSGAAGPLQTCQGKREAQTNVQESYGSIHRAGWSSKVTPRRDAWCRVRLWLFMVVELEKKIHSVLSPWGVEVPLLI